MRTFDDLVPDAEALARAWMHAAQEGAAAETTRERRTTRRLARLVADPDGLELALRFVDRVVRPRDDAVAARELARLRGRPSTFLSVVDRTMLGAGALTAPALPRLVVPAARARLRSLVGHLVADDGPRLGEQVARLRDQGFRVNVNLLGEAVLGEQQARERARRLLELVRRPDIDYVSVKTSSVVPQISTWDTAGSRDRVLRRLRPVARAAAADGTFVNLDMEEYRDLELTLEVFEALADDPGLAPLCLGVALQAYLPDASDAFERVAAIARRRRAAGGAPVKVRLVKGANLAMEHVEAELHGWQPTPYPTKADVDASFLDLVDRALAPRHHGCLRVGVASHNLFHVALAHLVAVERGVTDHMDVEMLQGMAPAQARVVREATGSVLLYLPAVAPEDFDVAVGYLVRRLEENAAPQNYLHAAFGSPDAMAAQAEAFRVAVARRSEVGRTPRRLAPPEPPGAHPAHPAHPAHAAHPDREPFHNASDADPALPGTRARAATLVDGDTDARLLANLPAATYVLSPADVDEVLARATSVSSAWAAAAPSVRAAVLRDAANRLEDLRGDLTATAVHEAGKTVAEADPEVSEAVDFARYYALAAEALEDDPDATFEPDGVTLVTPPWNFPVAIPCGSVLAALAAGSAVVVKPSHVTPRCTQVAMSAVRDALEAAGFEADTVQVVLALEGEVGRAIVTHHDVARVILTGSIDTARTFAGWRPDVDVLAETSGKNAIVVTPSADVDVAVTDVVRSAFGHAGQKCSAASLLILVGSAGTDDRLRRQLADAVTSLRVGWPTDLGTAVGPLTTPAEGKLWRALTTLEAGESWLVEPHPLDVPPAGLAEGRCRLWTPGVRSGVQPGSWFHRTEVFGPVLGVVRVATLDDAIDVQNAVAFGLTAGLHSLDEEEIARWKDRVEAGNLYVNRHTTGAIVQRQPFGGWKESVVGPGAKAGGPHYVAQLGRWHDAEGVPDRGAEPEAWLQRSLASDERVWAERFSREHDPSRLTVESNVLRYVPVPDAVVRVGAGSSAVEVRRVVAAAERCGVPVTLSVDPGWGELPAEVRPADGAGHGARTVRDVRVEDADRFVDAVARGSVHGRVRALGETPGLRAAAAPWAGRTTVLDRPVVASGERELLAFLREQAVSTTLHRHGHVPAVR
ncbi:aldehyde dehydrogenase family protein [Sanguibacter hominis ATCC BAA-789]|uniref:L-glutamate gamma-semialdehyde dehydrogenase n=1 Tax=Sanguibacter hominis ATCC BAA-789 TaxID=1312740 RepID=A0A9X5IRV4_9MICO|nr:proline dehydrogenase family protein [Sanguibacter hominis]NKX93995.1 aldehyde dehydrogenase family protein [Sanguibacter hominis ATCC BAA-789]